MPGDLRQKRESSSNSLYLTILSAASRLDRVAMGMLRAALVLVLVWIGGLKFVNYEADSIVPLVANSPLMSFLYRQPAEYRSHMNKEGELNPQHRAWHQENGTYSFSHGLGVVIVSIGILIALYPLNLEVSALGSFLLILMSCATLSFLITTPEAWVPAIGDAEHGFPYLSGAGRLIVKDSIMLAAALVTLADSAKSALRRRWCNVFGGGSELSSLPIREPSRCSKGSNMHSSFIVAAVLIGAGFGSRALAQSAKDIRGPSPLIAIENEPPARLIVDPPIPEALAKGRVFIQYRTENLRIVPVFGKAAVGVTPRIGHIHITVDHAPWHFVDASGETIILVGLAPGPHSVLIDLADPTHKVITSKTIEFTVPDVHNETSTAK